MIGNIKDKFKTYFIMLGTALLHYSEEHSVNTSTVVHDVQQWKQLADNLHRPLYTICTVAGC